MDTLETNILRHYTDASPDAREAAAWYGRGRSHVRRIARETGATERAVAGVVAALSPRQHWSVNLRIAEEVVRAARQGQPCPAVSTGANRAKAWRIANGERPLDVLGGPKVRAFYRNLTGNLDLVTVDVWAARAAGLTYRDGQGIDERTYARVAVAYANVAEAVGIRPAELQAIVWAQVRAQGYVRSNGVAVRGRAAHE